MQAIRRVSEPTIERRGGSDDRIRVRFGLNRQPEETWIRLFKAHAASSVLDASNAIFSASEASIDVAKPSGVAELATALDCFIECANLQLRSFGGQVPERRSTAFRERSRILGRD